MDKYRSFLKAKWFTFVAGLLLGALIVLGIRFAAYTPERTTHYHANFAVYINGERERFKGPVFYEEDAAKCTASNDQEDEAAGDPRERAHMHDNVNNVVHVEGAAVTWGNFFENLGWTLGETTLITDKGRVYQEQGMDKLHVILNGQDYTDLGGVENRVIKDRDKLLISFGNMDNKSVMTEYGTIPSTAHHYDTASDPKSCSGQHKATMRERMRHMF